MSKTNEPPKPNDQRSDVKNANNPSYASDRENRQKLGHADVPPRADRPAARDPKK